MRKLTSILFIFIVFLIGMFSPEDALAAGFTINTLHYNGGTSYTVSTPCCIHFPEYNSGVYKASDNSLFASFSSYSGIGDTWTINDLPKIPEGVYYFIIKGDRSQNLLIDANGHGTTAPVAIPQTKLITFPSTGNVIVGVPFTVDVKIDDNADLFNAVRSNVAVSSNLSVTSISAPSSNACNLFYVQQPVAENLSFAGAIFGGSSTGCTVYRLTLTPQAPGTGTITFSNASIKAYINADEILTGVQNGSFIISDLVTLPELTVTSPNKTYLSSFHLFGTKDPAVTHVFVNDSETGSTYPSSTTWDSTVNLALGANTFTLHGENNTGNQTPALETAVTRHILGDINGDGVVDLTDASLFAVDWDKTENLTYILSDMNNDGIVSLTDLSILAKLVR